MIPSLSTARTKRNGISQEIAEQTVPLFDRAAACRADGGSIAICPRGIDSPPQNKVIVNYWEKWTGKEGEAIQSIVDDFNNTQGQKQGIFVRCLGTSDPEQKTLVSTAGGVPPDIAGLYDFDISQFASRNALLPLMRWPPPRHQRCDIQESFLG